MEGECEYCGAEGVVMSPSGESACEDCVADLVDDELDEDERLFWIDEDGMEDW